MAMPAVPSGHEGIADIAFMDVLMTVAARLSDISETPHCIRAGSVFLWQPKQGTARCAPANGNRPRLCLSMVKVLPAKPFTE